MTLGTQFQRRLAHMVALATALAAALPACRSLPARRDIVTDVDFVGTASVDEDSLEEGLATAGSSRFLGIWDGVFFDYQVFDENVLARDLERVERFYRARGYYEARVTAGRIIRVDDHRVRVEVHVEEGQPVRVRNASLTGIERIPLEVSARTLVLFRERMEEGRQFDEGEFEDTAKRITEILADAGYAFAEVKYRAKVDVAQQAADVAFEVKSGPLARYGKVRILGLEAIPEAPVRANLDIREGRRYSRKDLDDAREALLTLGRFSSVEIREDKSKPETGTVPINAVVRESSLRTIRLGGGARFDVLRLSNHLRVGWEHKNFMGGMRRFSIEARPGVVYFPTRIGRFDAPTRLLPENTLRAELHQPSFLEGRTTGFVAGEYSIAPLLYPLPDSDDFDVDAERIIGYHSIKAQTGVERAFFSHHLFLTPSYNWEANFPFTYQGGVPDGLETVRVAFPEFHAVLDFRDDRIQPHSGVYLSSSVQLANKIFGGSVSDLRLKPELRTYVPVSKKVTLATRTAFGFLFPFDYGATLDPDNTRTPTAADVIRDQHKLLFRVFYSGGPSSNRGYPFRGVGPHGPVGFLVPTGQNCDTTVVAVEDLPSACIRPIGGLTLWEASIEVRFPITGPLEAATFVDASDVTRNVAEIRFTVPHLSVGPGVRYLTPVGPFRLDVGYRVPGLQQIGEEDLQVDEGDPGTVFGLPIAVHIALGEAF
jgi:outer membrane protein insertion porin family/translocation and assembly module TamA